MAGSFSNTLENKVLDHIFMNTSYTMPTNLWVALGTAGSDTAFTELAATGAYARVSTSGATWTAATGGSLNNGVDITFPTATADWNAGSNISYFAIYDASTAGNFIAWGSLTTAKAILNGDTAKFLTGSIVVTLD